MPKIQFWLLIRQENHTIHPSLSPVRLYYNKGVGQIDYFRMIVES